MEDLSSQISIGTDTMQVGTTSVTLKIIEDHFKDLRPNIVGKTIDYSSLDEEEEKRKNKENKIREK